MARIYKNGLQHTCDHCGEPVNHRGKPDLYGHRPWARIDKKYCSNACKQKSFRLRRRLARNAAKKTTARKRRAGS